MIGIRKKILFGITSLGLGGAERVLVDISNKLSKKYDITIFSIYDKGELKRELKKNIKFKSMYSCEYNDLNKLQKIWSSIRILLFSNYLYNKYIKDAYDVEISFLEGPVTRLFSKENKCTRKIAWIHNDIKHVFGTGIKAKIKKHVDRKTYDKYDNLIFVSKDNMKSFKEIYSDIPESKMSVIYNYINSELVIEKSSEQISTIEFNDTDVPKFVTICRLVKQKAIDRYIKVHSKLIKNRI